MGVTLHVPYIVGKPAEGEEAHQPEEFHRAGLLANELGLQLVEAHLSGQFDDLGDERLGQSASAELGMYQNTHAPNVAFPAAKLLVERGIADDLSVQHRKQRQIAAQVDVLAPVVDDGG